MILSNLNAIHQDKVFPFFSLYGLGPFACLNSELTSETINACPILSRTPWRGILYHKVTTYTELNTQNMEEFKSTILVKQVKVLDCTTTVMSSYGHKYSYSKYYEHGNGNHQSV